MKETPILFSTPMVRAILAGHKTQTRRVEPKLVFTQRHTWRGRELYDGEACRWFLGPRALGDVDCNSTSFQEALRPYCPYGVVGDQLWVRESWMPGYDHQALDLGDNESRCEVIYHGAAGEEVTSEMRAAPDDVAEHWARTYAEDGDDDPRWRPSIHMPRRASRLTLEIAEIRVQRLQDLTPEDAQAEGIQVARCGCEVCSHTSAICPADGGAYIEAFAALWDSINGKRAPWGANPWVWALTFRRVDVPSQAKST